MAPSRQELNPGRPALRPAARSGVDEMQHQGQGAAGGAQGMRVAFKSRGNVRFGAAVYGSFLVASVVGVAFEVRQDARAMTIPAA